jgi:hypothetical protein
MSYFTSFCTLAIDGWGTYILIILRYKIAERRGRRSVHKKSIWGTYFDKILLSHCTERRPRRSANLPKANQCLCSVNLFNEKSITLRVILRNGHSPFPTEDFRAE